MGADFKRFLHLIQELSRGFDGILNERPKQVMKLFGRPVLYISELKRTIKQELSGSPRWGSTLLHPYNAMLNDDDPGDLVRCLIT